MTAWRRVLNSVCFKSNSEEEKLKKDIEEKIRR
jgi:hypothetical protein